MESETERAFGGAAAPPAADPREADPERSLGARDAGEALTRAVGALSARQRLVLALRYRDGLEVAAAARALAIAPAQVERLTREGLEAIRAALGAERITRDEIEGGLGAWWIEWEGQRAQEDREAGESRE